MKRCCFAGHNRFYDKTVGNLLKKEVLKLIKNEGVKEFWVGNYGGFDRYAASIIKELKENGYDIKLELVIPYLTKLIEDNKEFYEKTYDCILISDIPEKTPSRYKILKTNEYMINKSDFLICFIENSWGGAFKTFEYAQKKKKKIINLAEK